MSDLTNALSNPPQDKTKLLGKLVEMLEKMTNLSNLIEASEVKSKSNSFQE